MDLVNPNLNTLWNRLNGTNNIEYGAGFEYGYQGSGTDTIRTVLRITALLQIYFPAILSFNNWNEGNYMFLLKDLK